jgi:hypothetical protein
VVARVAGSIPAVFQDVAQLVEQDIVPFRLSPCFLICEIMDDYNYNVLFETDKLILRHVYEKVYLTDKQINNDQYLGSVYGDPSCGIISSDNSFCLAGGADTLILWNRGDIRHIDDKDLYAVFDIKQVGSDEVEILTDPWSENSAIWSFRIDTLEKIKMRDFAEYIDKEYTDKIEW